MNEQELRELVREAIARHLSASPPAIPPSPIRAPHSSHALFLLQSGGDGDGVCLIEQAVACNHCGYCKSYGH